MGSLSRRSPHAQLEAMRRHWPDFYAKKEANGLLWWYGPLQPQALRYLIEIYWRPGVLDRPWVIIDKPAIMPIAGKEYEDIPHLIFNEANPERSALCLFDPEGNEWRDSDLIAETTVWWAAEWLNYYELWHVTGEWLAPSVGFESVGHMKAVEEQALREAAEHVHR